VPCASAISTSPFLYVARARGHAFDREHHIHGHASLSRHAHACDASMSCARPCLHVFAPHPVAITHNACTNIPPPLPLYFGLYFPFLERAGALIPFLFSWSASVHSTHLSCSLARAVSRSFSLTRSLSDACTRALSLLHCCSFLSTLTLVSSSSS